MAFKNTKRNTRSIYWIKYVTCAKVLQDLNETHISLVHCRDINTQTFLRLEIKFSPLLSLVVTNFS